MGDFPHGKEFHTVTAECSTPHALLTEILSQSNIEYKYQFSIINAVSFKESNIIFVNQSNIARNVL